MRRMYSESQLLRLIKENSSSTKDYNHRIVFTTSDQSYVVDFRLTSSQADAFTAKTLGKKFTRVPFICQIYDANNLVYTIGSVYFDILGTCYLTLINSDKKSYLPTDFEDSVTED